jgi:hypothetical protein
MVYRRAVGAALLLLASTGCENRTIVPVEVAAVDVSPSSFSVVEGESRIVRAIPRGPGGDELTNRTVTWATDAASVATVGADGTVEGVREGQTTVRATVDAVVGTAEVTVLAGPSVSLSASTVSITAFAGQAAAVSTVEVTNGGNGVISGLTASTAYRAGEPEGWLSAALSGTTAPAELSLAASAASLSTGSYRATVTVSSPVAGGVSASVTVDLTVEPPPPAIVLDVDAVSFSGVVGGQVPARQEVAVANGGSGTLSGLSASVDYQGGPGGWLQAELTDGTAPTVLVLRASAGLLASGRYHAVVDVSSSVASNSPQRLTVEFEIAPPSAPGPGTRTPGPHPPEARRP